MIKFICKISWFQDVVDTLAEFELEPEKFDEILEQLEDQNIDVLQTMELHRC